MGACSSKPKTTEFEESMNSRLQEESTETNLDDESKRGCNAPGWKIIDSEKKISSKCSFQNLQPAIQNEHGSIGDALLDSKEGLARSSFGNNQKETCAGAEETCDAKHHFVAERESQVPEIAAKTSKLQNTKPPVGQEIHDEPAFAQIENVLSPCRDSVLFKEVVVELSQKVAFRDIESEKFQIIENINEDKELLILEGGKPRVGVDAEEGNPVSCGALQEPVFMASRAANVNSKWKKNNPGNLTNSGTEKICPASRAPNGPMQAHNGKIGDVILGRRSGPVGLDYGAWRHDLEETLNEQSVPLIVRKTQDRECFIVAMSNGSSAVKENDVSNVITPALVGLPELSPLSNGILRNVAIKVDKFACLNLSPSALKSSEKGTDRQVKEPHIAVSMVNELPFHLPNFTESFDKHSVSADENLGVHETENCSFVLVNTKVEEDSMAWRLGQQASDMIPGEDGTPVGLRKGSEKPFSVACTNESIITEALDSQTSSQEANCYIEGEQYTSKKGNDLIFFPNKIKIFKEVHVIEPPRSIYGKDMASDIDEVLEKLASEFERQESLSSFLP